MLFAGTSIVKYRKQVLMPAPGSEAGMRFAPPSLESLSVQSLSFTARARNNVEAPSARPCVPALRL